MHIPDHSPIVFFMCQIHPNTYVHMYIYIYTHTYKVYTKLVSNPYTDYGTQYLYINNIMIRSIFLALCRCHDFPSCSHCQVGQPAESHRVKNEVYV